MIMLNNAHAACSKDLDMQPLPCISSSYTCKYITASPVTLASYCTLLGLQPASACIIHFCCDCRQTMLSMLLPTL